MNRNRNRSRYDYGYGYGYGYIIISYSDLTRLGCEYTKGSVTFILFYSNSILFYAVRCGAM